MNLFNNILIDFVLVVFPLLIYTIYSMCSITLDKKKNNLYFDFALFSAYYLILKFGVLDFGSLYTLFLDIPLMFAYIKDKKISILILSILNIINYYRILDINILYIVLEYLGYYIVYVINNKIKLKQSYFILYLVILKSIAFLIFTNLSDNYIFNFTNYLAIVILNFILINIITLLYDKIENIIDLHSNIYNIKEEETLRKSIFNITHEIKNPIAVCKGYLDMFDINDLDRSVKYIPILKSETDRLLKLLEDFLSITKVKVEKEEMDLNMLLEDTIKCLKPIINNKNIEFISNITDDEIYINADYNRLKQTLVNIIKNSKEAIQDKGYIKLYTNVNNKNIKICIEDSGIGMDAEELKKIKQAFFTTKKTGTGLGVYLANEIITLHSGKIDYYSKKNEGTMVVITLPV